MKKLFAVSAVILCLFSEILMSACSSEKSEPWDAGQLMPPGELAAVINNPDARRPLIVCIGPGALIKGSVDVGQTGEEQNLEKLRQLLANEDRNREIVIYCGCCPFEKCPNIRPAFSLLNEMKFTNHQLLNLATNLKTDWIDHGYPVE